LFRLKKRRAVSDESKLASSPHADDDDVLDSPSELSDRAVRCTAGVNKRSTSRQVTVHEKSDSCVSFICACIKKNICWVWLWYTRSIVFWSPTTLAFVIFSHNINNNNHHHFTAIRIREKMLEFSSVLSTLSLYLIFPKIGPNVY